MNAVLHALAPILRRLASVGEVWRWPSQCRVCGAWPGPALCEPCISTFAQPSIRCRRCALPLPRAVPAPLAGAPDGMRPGPAPRGVDPAAAPVHPRLCRSCAHTSSPLASCHAALDYAYPWNRCIAAFKYGRQPGLARTLGTLMWHAPGIAPALEQVDLVVPMPLSSQRLHARGFNQAHELARELERHRRWDSLHTPTRARTGAAGRYHPHLLHRVRDTEAQSSLDAARRRSNLAQAFCVLPVDHPGVRGRHVAVIDDIMTTGASLHEASRALLQAGALSVVGVVLARTPEVS